MAAPSPSLLERIELLESIAFVAVEFEQELDLPRLVNFVDLYAQSLRGVFDGDEPPPFDAFVRDVEALANAAEAAGRESGLPTNVPTPLQRAVTPD